MIHMFELIALGGATFTGAALCVALVWWLALVLGEKP